MTAAIDRPLQQRFRGETLLTSVDALFVAHAADLVDWFGAWVGEEPGVGAYARRSSPGKYRIPVARARAWTDALVRAGLATTEEHRGQLTLRPIAPGALPLGVEVDNYAGATDNWVALSAGDVVVRTVPECYCDACDLGASGAIALVDNAVLSVLEGGVLQIRGSRRRSITVTIDGCRTEGRFAPGEEIRWLSEARHAPDHLSITAGAPWL